MPLPWSGDGPPFGFSPPDAAAPPWLPQPPTWRRNTAATLEDDPASILNLYRTALGLRRTHPALGDGTLRWLPSPESVLLFAREPGFVCAVNFSPSRFPLPDDAEILLTSAPLTTLREVPSDTAVWWA